MVCATIGVIVQRLVTPAKGEGTGESTALREIIATLTPGTLIIGDAIYEDHFAWALLAQTDCSAIFDGSRQPSAAGNAARTSEVRASTQTGVDDT